MLPIYASVAGPCFGAVQVAENVELGLKEVVIAEKTQKAGRMMMCIIALIVLIVIMLIIVIVRHA